MKNLKNLLMNYSLTIIILMQAPAQLFCASADPKSAPAKKANPFAALDFEDFGSDDDVASSPESPTKYPQFNPTEEMHAAFASGEADEDDQRSWSPTKKSIKPKYKTYNFATVAALEEKDPSKCCSGRDINSECFTTLRKYAQSPKFDDSIAKSDITTKKQLRDYYHMTLLELNLKINTSNILTDSDIRKLKEQINETLRASVLDVIIKYANGMELTSNTLVIFNFKHIVAAFYNPQDPNPTCSDFKTNVIDRIESNFNSTIKPLIMKTLPANSTITITNKLINARPHITLASMTKGYDDKIIDKFENAVVFTINPTNRIYTNTYFDN